MLKCIISIYRVTDLLIVLVRVNDLGEGEIALRVDSEGVVDRVNLLVLRDNESEHLTSCLHHLAQVVRRVYLDPVFVRRWAVCIKRTLHCKLCEGQTPPTMMHHLRNRHSECVKREALRLPG